jgi:hypothetical protein
VITVEWDAAPLPSVSLVDHYKSISIWLHKLYREVGHRGVIVTSPEIAAIIDIHHGFKSTSNWNAGWPTKIGTLCGLMDIWIDPLMPINLAGAYNTPGGQELGRFRVLNICGRDYNVLDQLAAIEPDVA